MLTRFRRVEPAADISSELSSTSKLRNHRIDAMNEHEVLSERTFYLVLLIQLQSNFGFLLVIIELVRSSPVCIAYFLLIGLMVNTIVRKAVILAKKLLAISSFTKTIFPRR